MANDKVISQEYWLKQFSPTNQNLTECFFTDTLNGWICGDSGLIISTTNKGQNWILQNSGTNNNIVSLFFTNKNTGYALSHEFDKTPPNHYGSRILSTSDGGNTWDNYLFPDTNLFLNSIFFLDSLNGYMAGSNGKIFYTINAGSNWIKGVIDSGLVLGFPIEKIKFYNAMTGYAAGGAFDLAGVMWNSTNGGISWRAKVVGPEPVYDFHIFDSLNILGVGGDYEYGASKISSTSGGAFWDYAEIGVFGIANSIGFRTETEVWSGLGIVDSFLFSTNSGNNWTLVGTPDGININDLVFINSTNGWAIGKAGAILKFNADLINISEEHNYLPKSISLYQNYPNPFNPVTVIRYSLSENHIMTLKVFDTNGKEVKTLFNGRQAEGNYEMVFDGSNLPSGIYFYRISVLDETANREYYESKKMILLK